MQKLFLILIIFFSGIAIQQSSAQSFFVTDDSNKTYELCTTDCNVNVPIINCTNNLIDPLDLAVDSNLNVYYVLPDGTLYKTNLNDSTYCQVLGFFPELGINGLTMDSSGVIYAGGNHLTTYDTKTGLFADLGELPAEVYGDIFTYGGDLYYVSIYSTIYKINKADPSSSTQFMDLGQANNPVFGCFSINYPGETKVYILVNNGGSSTLKEINMQAKTISADICTYPFDVGGAAAFNNVKCPSTTPVIMSSFNYFIDNNDVLLKWETTTEYDNMYFDIEKSEDGIHFNAIGKVAGAGNRNSSEDYSFSDNHPSANNYYRLKQVDRSGSVAYSKILYVKMQSTDDIIRMSPSTDGNKLQLLYNSSIVKIKQASIIDFSGRRIRSFHTTNNLQSLDISFIPHGIYVLQIITVDGRIFNREFKTN